MGIVRFGNFGSTDIHIDIYIYERPPLSFSRIKTQISLLSRYSVSSHSIMEEFNQYVVKVNYKILQPDIRFVYHAPTPPISPVRIPVVFIGFTAHRWINRPFDRGHSQLVIEHRDPTVRISSFIYAQSYPESHAIITGILKDLGIGPAIHNSIIGAVFQWGQKVLNWESKLGWTIVPLRVQIQILHVHVRDERGLVKREMIDIIDVGNIKSCKNEIKPRLIKWHFPMPGHLKLNTDGCSKGNPGRASFGGVLRDDRGEWIMGFYGKLPNCASLEAELWGIYRGLKAISDRDLKHVEIETDSKIAMQLVRDGPSRRSRYADLIQDCKELMRITESSIEHAFREGNQVADRLANMGVEQDAPIVSLLSPPVEIGDLLAADMAGVSYERP